MTDSLKVRKFIYYEISSSGDVIVQNDSGIVKITDKGVIKLISELEKNSNRYINADYIQKLFPETSDDVIRFLIKYGIFEKPSFYNFNIEKLHFLSNDPKIGELTDYVLKEHTRNYEYTFSKDISITLDKKISLLNQKCPKKTFWLIFLNPYSKKEAKKIRDTFLNDENSYLVISYIYNNSFYIDSIYSSEWKSPCHLCQIGWTESELRDNVAESINYQKIIDILYGEIEELKIGFPLSASQTVNITSQLSNHVLQHIGSERNSMINPIQLGEGFVMDLKTFKSQTDTTIHWELCDCYE
ncbi:McbB family protein [Virgibacillus sp. AGTR]|uniref:McbB family protein n=1 Tax=Virgibacillus sp. AGTR TaxID=2812055 RepID=UPI001D16E6CB|nr:McbB family protein [Virgibacillus sp. AGTR]MCC2251894.1 McbB family protein [Virgibacillus sp. AGTR]